MREAKRDIGTWVFTAGMVALFSVLYLRPTPTAPVPGLFETGSATLDEAMDRAEESGRVVFAFATADWCAPCQGYKKGALMDERVVEWVRENAVPVYVDVDRSREDAQRLGVRGLPATYLIDDGKIVALLRDPASADKLLGWLEANAPVSHE